MIKLFLLIALLSHCAIVVAVEVNPNVEPQKVLNCTLPLEYTDGTPIQAGDITEVRLHRSQTDGSGYSQVQSGSECRFVVDTTVLTGTQYYVATVMTSIHGESGYSNQEVLDIVIKAPNAPTQLNWE